MFRSVTLLLLTLVVFLHATLPAFSQTTSLSVTEWAKKLSDPSDKENKWYYELLPILNKLDSNITFNFLNRLGANAEEKGNYFIARFNCIKVEMLFEKALILPMLLF